MNNLVQLVTCKKAEEIIDTRKPRGRFYSVDPGAVNQIFIGIHNMAGEAVVRSFSSFEECFDWLVGHGTPKRKPLSGANSAGKDPGISERLRGIQVKAGGRPGNYGRDNRGLER